MKPLVFIPCFNDAETLPSLIRDLQREIPGCTILVCDDGSHLPVTDHIAPTQDLVIYRLPYNVGLGLTTSIAVDYFLKRQFDVFVRCDADGQHPVQAVKKVINEVHLKSADVAWGQRSNHYQSTGLQNILSAMSKLVVGTFGRFVFKTSIRDWHTGLMAFNRQGAHDISRSHLERFCEVQLLCILLSKGRAVHSVLIEQMSRTAGRSSINLLSGLLMVFRSVLTISLYAIRMHPR